MHSLTLKRKKRGTVTFQRIPERAAHARSSSYATLFSPPFGGVGLPSITFSISFSLYFKSESQHHGTPFPPGWMSSLLGCPEVHHFTWLVKHLGLVHYSPTETFYFPVPEDFHGNVLATTASTRRATCFYSGDRSFLYSPTSECPVSCRKP